MSELFGLENIFGIGYGWQNDTILNLIGLSDKDIRIAENKL